MDTHQLEQDAHKLYDTVLYLYRHEGFQTHSLATYTKSQKIFDSQAQKILEEDFKAELFDQVWEHVDSSHVYQKQVIKIAQAWVDAYRILRSRINQIESSTGVLSDHKLVLKHRRQEIENYRMQENHYQIKRITNLENQCEYLQKQIADLQQNYKNFKQQLQFINTVLIYNQKKISLLRSQEYDKNTQSLTDLENRIKLLSKQSKSLKLIFYLTLVGIICQLSSMILQSRNNFLPLFAYLLAVQVLFIGYIKYRIVIYLIMILTCTVMADFLYLYTYLACNPKTFDLGFSLTQIIPCPVNISLKYQIVCWILLTLSIFIRILLCIYWMKHSTIGKKRYYFIIWGHKVNLIKRVVVK